VVLVSWEEYPFLMQMMVAACGMCVQNCADCVQARFVRGIFNSRFVLAEGLECYELFPWAMGREHVYRVRKFSAGKLIGLGPFDECPLFLSDTSHISRSRHYCMPDACTVQTFPDRVIHLEFCEADGIIFRKGNKSNELVRITRNSCMRLSPLNQFSMDRLHTNSPFCPNGMLYG